MFVLLAGSRVVVSKASIFECGCGCGRELAEGFRLGAGDFY